ncbi:hypothetical protein COHA_001896 [Chlorella ohadii]|uniref:FAD-binding PCMH-type domain-containing protein n=1 Tax=Chlorella ohadii TaxID=2649997 RepID=A0AAD5DXT3_9CHLO|nr:hypothetical protein COHA_001896 [Chlorella ohadii]
MVGMFPRVKASGVGHSWFKEMFCAGNDSRSLNVVMTELQPTLDMMTSPVDPKTWRGKTVPASFPIQVDELAQTVTVAAGITQRVLLDYLAEYKYWKQPSGWTLPAFSWFLDQTIGGAAATASHGSSMKWGSLSSQLVSLKMVLANGTLAEFSPRKNPHLFNAVGASVGRLGVVTELTFRIVPQQAVQRTLKEMSFDDFVNQLQETQADYVAAKQAGDVDGMKRALFQVHETQAFWALPGASVQRVDYEHLDKEPSSVMLNIMPGAEPLVKSMSGPEDDIFAQQEKKAVAANARMPVNPRFWSNLYVSQLRPKLVSGTFESRKSYLSMSESETAVTSTFAPYRQHEVAIPMSRAASCLEEVGKEVYGPAKLWEGARTPFLLRFITAEDLYLSPAHGEPAMYINFEDYVSLSTGKPNEQFEQIARLFRERCGARWHWGKEGWTRHAKCFDGAKEYPKWCHFGCAVQELDPSGKFASEWDGWRFNATRGSAVVPFASCCSPQGFSAECQCASRGSCK